MLKRKGVVLVVSMLTVMMMAVGGDFVLSYDGPGIGGGPTPWSFTYPTDGAECMGAPTYMGTGPSNHTAILSIYSAEEIISGGVYTSELTLRESRFVDTQLYDVWSSGPYGSDGLWYASVIPRNIEEGLEAPALESSSHSPIGGDDVDALCFSLGGDGVSYRVISESGP